MGVALTSACELASSSKLEMSLHELLLYLDVPAHRPRMLFGAEQRHGATATT